MCDCLEGEDDAGAAGPAVPLDALMARTRALEARKPGERVPDRLWPVFFGLASGSIPWPHHQRMLACRQTAFAFLAADRAARRRARSAAMRRCTAEAPERRA
ncbi:MAG TPA: hypothetical protein VHL98_01280 [Microvirga sp.]|jgi:hypothetical protein|nr:hypothetical protein [Microvirga sp.]